MGDGSPQAVASSGALSQSGSHQPTHMSSATSQTYDMSHIMSISLNLTTVFLFSIQHYFSDDFINHISCTPRQWYLQKLVSQGRINQLVSLLPLLRHIICNLNLCRIVPTVDMPFPERHFPFVPVWVTMMTGGIGSSR